MSTIEYFNFENINKIEKHLKYYGRYNFVNEASLRTVLKTSNITMVVTDMSYAESILMGGYTDFPYINTSQKHINLKDNGYTVPPELRGSDLIQYKDYTDKILDLYDRMIQGGIPISDARYILPISITGNTIVSFSADKLLDIFILYNEYKYIYSDMILALKKHMTPILLKKIDDIVRMTPINRRFVNEYFESLNQASTSLNVSAINTNNDYLHILMAIFCYCTKDSPKKQSGKLSVTSNMSDIMSSLRLDQHSGLLEYSQSSYSIYSSILSYSIIQEYGISNVQHEGFTNILKRKLEMFIPKTIMKSEFINELNDLLAEYNNFIGKISDIKYTEKQFETAIMLLLNCHKLRYIMTTNAKMDNMVLYELLQNKSDEEIHTIYTKVYEYLMDNNPCLYTELNLVHRVGNDDLYDLISTLLFN